MRKIKLNDGIRLKINLALVSMAFAAFLGYMSWGELVFHWAVMAWLAYITYKYLIKLEIEHLQNKVKAQEEREKLREEIDMHHRNQR